MCLEPSFIWQLRGPKWEKVPVACRQCTQCRRNRMNDYIGRALCEAAYSDAACAVTLTYAPRDDLAERVITPEHFQRFIRSLRRAGHSVRYLVAGEYGEAKGRAHFHAVLFFKGTPPEMPQQQIFWFPKDARGFSHWPHGHVFADWNTSHASMRYVCKYLLKAEAGNRWFSLSKKPTLGHRFFMDKAEAAFEADVFPSSFTYLPPGGDPAKRYFLTGASRRDFMHRLLQLHAEAGNLGPRGVFRPQGRFSRLNEWVLKAADKVALWEMRRFAVDTAEGFEEEIERKRPSLGAVADMLYYTSEQHWNDVEERQDRGFGKWLSDVMEAMERGAELPNPPALSHWGRLETLAQLGAFSR